jgi:hypothetical protein
MFHVKHRGQSIISSLLPAGRSINKEDNSRDFNEKSERKEATGREKER